MFGVFCAGSSHVKSTRLKIVPQYEYAVVSSPFPTRGPVLKPRGKGDPCRTAMGKPLHLCLLRFYLPPPSPVPLVGSFLNSPVPHWNMSFLMLCFKSFGSSSRLRERSHLTGCVIEYLLKRWHLH